MKFVNWFKSKPTGLKFSLVFIVLTFSVLVYFLPIFIGIFVFILCLAYSINKIGEEFLDGHDD